MLTMSSDTIPLNIIRQDPSSYANARWVRLIIIVLTKHVSRDWRVFLSYIQI
jgi:hypothetical protein